MAQIDNIVQVFISRQTAQVDIASFDIPLILVSMTDANTAFATDKVRTYTSLEEVADDFPLTHPAYIMSAKLLSNDQKPATFKIGKVDASESETYVEALQAIIDIDDMWYALLADTHTDENILDLATTIQAMRKVYFTSSSSAGIVDQSVTDDIATVLFDGNMDRTALIYSPQANTQYPEASWVGREIVEVPGSNTWEYKELAGVTVNTLTGTEVSVAQSKGANWYQRIKGVPVTRRGKTSGNSWIDEIILVDWIHARIQEQVFFRMVNTKKIPFTDAGAAMIENEIRSVLSQAQANGGIDTFTVRAPRVLSIPEMQRAARTMGDFTFEARLQGAVSVVIIRGTVSA